MVYTKYIQASSQCEIVSHIKFFEKPALKHMQPTGIESFAVNYSQMTMIILVLQCNANFNFLSSVVIEIFQPKKIK